MNPLTSSLTRGSIRRGAQEANAGSVQMFSMDDLPPGTRIIRAPGKWATTEHAPSRLTVVVGEDGTVSHVFTG